MVSTDKDRRVLIEVLLFAPFHKIMDLPGCTGPDVGILTVVIIPAQLTDISVRCMRVGCEEGDIKRLAGCCYFRKILFHDLEDLRVLHPPPDIVVGRNSPCSLCPWIIADLIVPVLGEVFGPAAERKSGPCKEVIVIAFLFEDISQADGSRQEKLVASHHVVVVVR